MSDRASIYHLVVEPELHAEIEGALYHPANLDSDGFVHCSNEASVLPVANDYYAEVTERLLVLEIDPAKLTNEVRYEAAAPIAGGGTTHLAGEPQFPHVYGPIDVAAIAGVGVLGRGAEGYTWPDSFAPLSSLGR